jgi:NADH-quinone oxidoreductase subunit E
MSEAVNTDAAFGLSERALERVEWLRGRYPTTRALILPVLHMAQRENNGWVSPEVLRYVAELLPVPEMWVKEVATFYTMYNLKPIGRHHIQVCTNLCCAINSGERVLEHIAGKLGIHEGQSTPDGKFHLSRAECLGACGYGPMMQINDTFYERLTLSKVDEIIQTLASEPDRAPDPDWLFVGPGTGGTRVPASQLLHGEVDQVRARDLVVLPEHDHGHDADASTEGGGQEAPA